MPAPLPLPSNAPDHPVKTPQGRTIAVCPAQRRDDVQCSNCGLCANSKRKVIVGLKAHGPGKEAINERLRRLTVIHGT